MHRITLSVLLLVAVAGPLRAVPAQPWPAADCAILAKTFAGVTHIPLTATTAVATTFYEGAPKGTACLMSGTTTGLTQRYDNVVQALAATLQGWTDDTAAAADGPGSTRQGFAKAKRHVIFSLTNEPPPGKCEDVEQDACKVPRKLWTWTFQATAYQN